METGFAAALVSCREVAAFRILAASGRHGRIFTFVHICARKSVSFVSRKTGTKEAAQRVCAVSEHVTRPILALVLICSRASASAVSIVTVAFVIQASAVLAFSSLGQHAIRCAFEFDPVFVGSPEAIRLTVAQLRDVVQLENIRRFVHLTSEISFLYVKEEDFWRLF